MNDSIKMSFPVNPAYVSSIRLTVTSIANRTNFDIDEIEDIKTAVSEACIYVIKNSSAKADCNNFEIAFHPTPDEITVEILVLESAIPKDIDNDISIVMIKALVDEFTITKTETAHMLIKLLKHHKKYW
ncbi:MAG: ATP-binding protein [Turicibacter sp.]|nr:ATP-binding protein [Turicibacter sp.]